MSVTARAWPTRRRRRGSPGAVCARLRELVAESVGLGAAAGAARFLDQGFQTRRL
jgi:hypothetical protein